jgi:hypothetical protein
VSKILYDSELMATRKENEALKLSLFWTKYGAYKLTAAIRVRNQMNEDEPFNCNCLNCLHARRYSCSDDISSDDELETCGFEPLFKAKLRELGVDGRWFCKNQKVSKGYTTVKVVARKA